jgi:2-(1,2-epoxy-1,2-dihydrophenyl)acetyl-CoA isomerase
MSDEAALDTPDHKDDLLVRVDGSIARITLNRPDAGNSLTATQRETFLDWLARFEEDPAVRCIVLGATGRFFCTGADLRSTGPSPPRPDGMPERIVGDARRMMLRGVIKLMHALLDCEKPVIAAVQGTAAGVGTHLAFCCDLVVATESAKFIEVFARRGLVVDGLGSWLLPRLIGLQRAKELVLLADDVPAQRAYELGLVNRVVPDDELEATVTDLATRIAEGPTRAHAVNKWLLNRSLDLDRHSMAQEEAWMVDLLANTADAAEGVASYVDRRPTRFRGY